MRIGQDDMAEIMVENDAIGNMDDGIPHRLNFDINGMRPPGGLVDIDTSSTKEPCMFSRATAERA